MSKYIFSALVMAALFLTGCNGCNKNKSREKPDVSDIKVDIHLQRFDRDLYKMKGGDIAVLQQKMQQQYGPFFSFYVSQFIIGPRPVNDTANITTEAISQYLNDAYVGKLQDSIEKYFADVSDVEQELTQAMRYFKYYFPEAKIPNVVTINSGFALGSFTYGKDVLGVGLDLYMGGNNPDYDSAGIYQYLQHKMNRGYIARNSMEVMFNLYFGDEEMSIEKTLIEAMVDKGKKMYFLSYVLPEAPDSLLCGFTQRQTEWCENSEYEIWKFLNDKDLLYKNDYMDKKRYLDEAPTIAGMPADAPGNIGSWIGLQIVRKFVSASGGKISLRDVVTKYDAKTILEKSKYRPAKTIF